MESNVIDVVNEIWKDIPEYEGIYKVSHLGRVKSLPRLKTDFKNQSCIIAEKILKPSSQNGVVISKGTKNTRKHFLVKTLVQMVFYPDQFNMTVDQNLKKCGQCKKFKFKDNFHIRKNTREGLQSNCKQCKKVITRELYLRRKEHILEVNKKWREENIDYKRQLGREHFWNNREKYRIYEKENRSRANEIKLNRKKTDPIFKLKILLRAHFRKALINRRFIKNVSVMKLLGTDIATARSHIESKFQSGMTWENHGKWHIDHKIPLASAKTQEELFTLYHYTNLQPLWEIDNLRKGYKLVA